MEGCVALSLILEDETSANNDMFEIKDMAIDSKLVEVFDSSGTPNIDLIMDELLALLP